MYFEIYRDKSDEKRWRWKLIDGGKNLANSGQGFDTWDECLFEIRRVQQCEYAAICTDSKSKRKK